MTWYYAFGLLFLAPFVDPRRPLRLFHLDLLALVVVGYGPLHAYVERGRQPEGTLILAVVALAYLALRLLWTGLRRREGREPLVPLLPGTWLAVALVIVACLRVALTLGDRQLVVDVGAASVIGAHLVSEGQSPYSGELHRILRHADTYGPATYVLYVPFEQLFPWRFESRDAIAHVEAARAAALTFDLLTLGGLFLIGVRLRAGQQGRMLGLALAFAWATYPYSLLTLRASFNDVLVAALLVASMLALRSSVGRGALAALATAVKFVPAVVAPVLVAGTGERGRRSVLIAGAAFLAVVLAVFVPLLPDGGPTELYDRTIGFQQDRPPYSSVWARLRGVGWLQLLAQLSVFALGFLLAFFPRMKTPAQVAALAAGLVVAFQLTMTYWSAPYAVWFAPLAFIALFSVCDCRERAAHRRATRTRSAGAHASAR